MNDDHTMNKENLIQAVALEKIDLVITLRGPAINESLSNKERSQISEIIREAIEKDREIALASVKEGK